MVYESLSEDAVIPRVSSFSDSESLREHLERLGVAAELPLDEVALSVKSGSPMSRPIELFGKKLTNRWCIHPMEGWDGELDGRASSWVHRRWRRFGESGASLIWGGEAYAVLPEARANPRQLCWAPENEESTRQLYQTLLESHRKRYGDAGVESLVVGLQLTHSGRFCKPMEGKGLQPKIAYHHPILDAKFGIDPTDDSVVVRDDDLKRLVDQYVVVAKMAKRIGFDFVDLKACHGYLGHELLSAYDRPGRYGGDFTGRTRFLCELVAAVRSAEPELGIGVRLSLFDTLPFQPDPVTTRRDESGRILRFGRGIPSRFSAPYPGFGCDRNDPMRLDLTEPIRLLEMLGNRYGVRLFNLTAGSPYYNPHISRPAFVPPSDGYRPPEDPLVGVARQIGAVRRVKEAVPDAILVGTGYTYLQEYLPHVAQNVVRRGWVDFVGYGRMVLCYPDVADDLLQGRELDRKRICRTFSECTTAPRRGLISGCYPLDPDYSQLT